MMSNLYERYISNVSRFGHKFDEYANLSLYYNLQSNNSLGLYVALKAKLASVGLMQANFVHLNIQFNANKYIIQKDVEAFPLHAFGAQVGGVLALWLGVTIMLIFEVFEFVINLISACYHRVKRIEQSSDPETLETHL